MVDDRISVHFIEVLVDTVCKFLLGFDPDAFQHLFGHLAEKTLYEIEPGTMSWGKHKYKPAFRAHRKVVLDFLGLMRGMIVTDDPDDIPFRIYLIKLL